MAVNGGGQLCVAYSRDGYLPVCRQTAVPWQDYAWLPDVALVPADENVAAVDLTAADAPRAARSRTRTASGSPRCSFRRT
jgi:hypothetical protein